MSQRRAVALAWGSFGATVLLVCVQGFYVLSSGTPLLDTAKFGLNSFPLISVGALLGAFLLGLAVPRARQRDAIAAFGVTLVVMTLVVRSYALAFTWYVPLGVLVSLAVGGLLALGHRAPVAANAGGAR